MLTILSYFSMITDCLKYLELKSSMGKTYQDLSDYSRIEEELSRSPQPFHPFDRKSSRQIPTELQSVRHQNSELGVTLRRPEIVSYYSPERIRTTIIFYTEHRKLSHRKVMVPRKAIQECYPGGL